MHRTRPPKATEAIPGLAVHAPVATNSAQGFSISECGAAAFQTGVEFSSRFMDCSGVLSELAVRFQDVRGAATALAGTRTARPRRRACPKRRKAQNARRRRCSRSPDVSIWLARDRHSSARWRCSDALFTVTSIKGAGDATGTPTVEQIVGHPGIRQSTHENAVASGEWLRTYCIRGT